MRPRHALLFVAALVFLMATASSAVAGGSWQMKLPSGAQVGTIRAVAKTIKGSPGANVWLFGHRYGQVVVAGTDGPIKGLWEALNATSSEIGDPWTGAYTAFRRVGANKAVAFTNERVFFRVVRGRSGSWRAEETVGGHVYYWGTVSRSCPGQYAVGAWFIYFCEGLYD